MDPKTAVNSSESDRQRVTAHGGCTPIEMAAQTDPSEHSDRAGQFPPIAATPIAAKPIGTSTTSSQRRVSLDPMRSTDRYRLVHPASTVL